MQLRHRLALVVTALGVAVGCPARPEDALEPIKIGVLSPLSGGPAARGTSRENATRLAGEEVNAGGGLFDGRPLQLIFKDSGSNVDIAVAAAQELVDEGVVGIVGPSSSGESGGVIPIVEEAEIPMISCCATSAELTAANEANAGFFFRTAPSDELQGKALAFIADNGIDGGEDGVTAAPCPNVAFINRDDSYGTGFAAVFTSELEGDIIATGSYAADANQQQLQAAATTLAQSIDAQLNDQANPDLCIVVIALNVDGGTVIAKLDEELTDIIEDRTQADSAFSLDYRYLVGDGTNSQAFADLVQDVGSRIVGTVPSHADNAGYAQFRKAFQTRYEDDSEPLAFTSQSYDAVFVMALAITQAKSTVGKEIRNKLYGVSGQNGGTRFEGAFFGEVAAAILAGDEVDYVGPSGELTFDAFGAVVGDYVLWSVEPTDGGGYAVVERQALAAADFDQ